MAGTLQVVVRVLHLLGMVVLLGGAAAVWYVARSGADRTHQFARHYEWAFWGALGVIVVTGVGNLGAMGAPGPNTRWGSILSVKLAVVVAFVLGSIVRTNAVALLDGAGRTGTARSESEDDRAGAGEPVSDGGRVRDWGRQFYRWAYGATTVTLLAVVVLAEVLAHG